MIRPASIVFPRYDFIRNEKTPHVLSFNVFEKGDLVSELIDSSGVEQALPVLEQEPQAEHALDGLAGPGGPGVIPQRERLLERLSRCR